jgi:hypothetical protein
MGKKHHIEQIKRESFVSLKKTKFCTNKKIFFLTQQIKRLKKRKLNCSNLTKDFEFEYKCKIALV